MKSSYAKMSLKIVLIAIIFFTLSMDAVKAENISLTSAPGCKNPKTEKPKPVWFLSQEELKRYVPKAWEPANTGGMLTSDIVVPIDHKLEPLSPIAPKSAAPMVSGKLIAEPAADKEIDVLGYVTDTTEFPWRTICKLYVDWPNGSRTSCSGAYILGNTLVLTAGHCIYDRSLGGWPESVVIIPGKNGAVEPYGQFYGEEISALAEWVNRKNDYEDMAVLKADRDSGLGYMGWTYRNNVDDWMGKTISMAGYPAYFQSGHEMFQEDSDVVSYDQTLLSFYGSSEPGMSGCPIWHEINNIHYIISELVAGEVDNEGVPVCPGLRLGNLLNDGRMSWLMDKAVEWGQKTQIALTSNSAEYVNGQTVQVKLLNRGSLTRNLDLYAVVQLEGQNEVYFLPNLTRWPTKLNNGYVFEQTILMNFTIEGITTPFRLNVYAALISPVTGEAVSDPAVTSLTLSFKP